MEEKYFSIEKIKNAYKKKGYVFFENGNFNLNIFGIRSKIREAGKFDDFIGYCYKNEKGIEEFFLVKATTDAGTHWLKNPMNKKGTAILVPNQYRGVYQIGLHQGKYEALVQVKPMSVYRDNDKDIILEFDESKIEKGLFGINIHRSNPRTESVINEKWSAGCQVFSNALSYFHFMTTCHKSSRIYGNSFTYTLFDEQDFENL
jgi:hypothetical protein